MTAILDAETLSACWRDLPPVHFQAESWEGDRVSLCDAVQEWLAYTQACRQCLTALQSLPPVPLGYPLGEWV